MLAAVGALVVAGVAAGLSQATAPGSNGRIVVFGMAVGAVNGPGDTLNDLYVMGPDGTHRRPITRTRNYDGSPDWGSRR
jgi:hypothetical protein